MLTALAVWPIWNSSLLHIWYFLVSGSLRSYSRIPLGCADLWPVSTTRCARRDTDSGLAWRRRLGVHPGLEEEREEDADEMQR
jgi:hypothetical protein